MSTLLEFAAEIRAVYEERDSLRKARAVAAAELSSMQRDRGVLREGAKALAARVTELEALLDRKQLVNDALRDELVAEQTRLAKSGAEIERLSYHLATWNRVSALYPDLTISEIVSQVLDLAKRGTAATPAVDEVDGFRVGDLVEYARGPFGALYGRISAFDGDYANVHGADRVNRATAKRKPVEVGDTVRCVSGPFARRVGYVQHDHVACMGVCTGPGEGTFWTEPSKLVAVAP